MDIILEIILDPADIPHPDVNMFFVLQYHATDLVSHSNDWVTATEKCWLMWLIPGTDKL